MEAEKLDLVIRWKLRPHRGQENIGHSRDLMKMPLPGLKQFSWHIVDNENNVSDPVLTWNRLFTDVADSHAPLKKCRVKGTPAPWMNNKIAEAMRDARLSSWESTEIKFYIPLRNVQKAAKICEPGN